MKLVPLITTFVPTPPEPGVKPMIVGAETGIVNEPGDVPVPPPVVTEIVPLVAPLGTVAVIWVALFTV